MQVDFIVFMMDVWIGTLLRFTPPQKKSPRGPKRTTGRRLLILDRAIYEQGRVRFCALILHFDENRFL